MKPTPETDAACGYALTSHYGPSEGSYLSMDKSGPFVHTEVARKLERERDELREEWGRASMDAAQLLSEKTKAIAERDELQNAIKTYYKAKGRYNSQIAAAKMFELVGLTAEYPKMKKEAK